MPSSPSPRKSLHYRHPISPYIGETLHGVVEATYLRGEPVYRDGTFDLRPPRPRTHAMLDNLDSATMTTPVRPCLFSPAGTRSTPKPRRAKSCPAAARTPGRLPSPRSAPSSTPQQLFAASDSVWAALPEPAWREAFDSHPRIGQQHAPAATAQSLAWSQHEQRAAVSPDDAVKLALAEGNRQYEERFGRIFIVCAAGRSAAEILAILNARMQNTAADELLEAAEQQRQITQLRLRRWLGAN